MRNICEETMFNLTELHRLEDQLERAKPGKSEIQKEIDTVRAKMIPNILGHHDRMRIRGKRSISEVKNGVCSGCHMLVAVGILATLRRMEDIQLCANCGRYLYITPEVPSVAAPAAEAPQEVEKPVKKRKPKAAPKAE